MCSHNHVFPHDCSTLKNIGGAGMGLALGTIERRHQCTPYIVIAMGLTMGILKMIWFPPSNKYIFSPAIVIHTAKVDSLLIQYHCHIRCVLPMNQPVLRVELRLGHVDNIAFFQSCISKSVGCSYGHLMLDHASPFGWQERISVLILLPDAVRMSDINSNCKDTRTLFSRPSTSLVYLA
jgi:hypothetical protein